MMIAEAHVEMEDSHWVVSLRAAFSMWKELPRENAGACHSWMRLFDRGLVGRHHRPPFRTELFVKMWKSAGEWRQGFEAKRLLRL